MPALDDDLATTSDHADNRKRVCLELQNIWNMYSYGRKLCFFLAIILTSYAAVQNVPPKVSKILPAIPFFSRNSTVADFYQGELSPAFEKISESDLSFVMYYAPWDAESQTVRAQFDQLAAFYKDQIYFAAVNCWHPNGECRRHFAKVQQFPVLIAYPALRGKGVQYRGVRKAAHMARFLQTALRPLYRVEAASDVLTLMASHDAVAVGCVDLSRKGRGYQAFYTAALRALEKDPFQEVAFAVATSRASCIRLGNPPEFPLPLLRLYLWNETVVYNGEWNGDSLVHWVFNTIHQVAVWVSLPGNKALSLSPYVEEGPALLLFTPRNPFYADTPYFELLREVGLEYYNCHNNSWVSRLARYLALERRMRKQRHRNAEKSCFSTRLQESASSLCQTTVVPTCATVTLPGAANLTVSTFARGAKVRSCQDMWSCQRDPWATEDFLIPSLSEGLPDPVGNITSMNPDDRVLIMGRRMREARCRSLLLGRRIQKPVFPKKSVEEPVARLQGLACVNNRSLSLLALDSLEFGQLAQQLGVDILSRPDRTAVVIFNSGQESHHELEAPITLQSLSQFLVNHTDGSLARALRSMAPQPQQDACSSDSSMCVPELTSFTFLPTILSSDDVVVLYHSAQCGLCGPASLAFLTAARLFRNTPNLLFARIDGEQNDLPWEFTMDTFPTILFMPTGRKSESRVFPSTKPITVETLTHFVLANLRPASRLQALVGLHGASPLARRHTLTALRDVTAQQRNLLRHPTRMERLLVRRRLQQRTQYLRLLHLALATEQSTHLEASRSLHRYHSLPTPPSLHS